MASLIVISGKGVSERRNMKRTQITIVAVLTGILFAAIPHLRPVAAQKAKVIVTAAQANGVYRFYDNEFRVLALGHGKLKVQFAGVYHTLAKSVNMGSASGEAMID